MSTFPTNHLSAWGRGNSLGPQFSALQKWSPRKVRGEQRRSVGLEGSTGAGQGTAGGQVKELRTVTPPPQVVVRVS